MTQRHDPKKGILVAAACILVFSSLYSIGFLSTLEHRLSDNLYGGATPLSEIVLVAIDDRSIQSIGRWPWDRAVFAELIDKLSQAKVIAIDVGFYEISNNESDQKLISAATRSGNVIVPIEFTRFDNIGGKVAGKDPLLPLSGLRQVAQAGYVNIQTDSDGITRSANLDISSEYSSFTALILKTISPSLTVPATARFLINFVGAPGSFARHSLVDALNGKISPEALSDKIVLVGSTAPDLHDEYFVPTSGGDAMPGVEIHANALQTLFSQTYLHPQPYWSVLLCILLAVLVAFSLLMRFSLRIALPLILLAIIGYVLIAIALFDRGIIMNLFYAPMSAAGSASALVAYFYVSERKARTFISNAFGKYVSPHYIDEMIKNPEKLSLGGEARVITIFFSDIRGFTSISEKLSATQLVHFMNDYLTEMTNLVLSTGGCVDKYIGDAIMAFWNAPLKQEDHYYRAADCSLKMVVALKKKQKVWEKDGLPYLDIGIGLNTGEAVIGNMGSHDRFNYTAMGDTINLGSRLEGVNKPYGTRIIVSSTTYDLLKDKYLLRPVDRIAVKGRAAPLMIYELLNSHENSTADEKAYAQDFGKALALYFEQKWPHAIKAFSSIKKNFKHIDSSETSSSLFIERCKSFHKETPGKKWDGVYVMKTK